MIDELSKTVRLAKADLDEATAELASTEHRVGSDLAELRSMQDMASSDSARVAAARRFAANCAKTPPPKKPIGNCLPSWRRPTPIPVDSWPRRTACWIRTPRCGG